MAPATGRRRRSAVLVGIAALVVPAVAACGSGSGSSDSGSSDSDIVIGATGPLSGPLQDVGSAFQAMDAYFDHLNAQGGIGGHKVRFVTKDDQFDPSKTPQQVRELVNSNKVSMLCGSIGSDQLASVAEYVTSQDVTTVAISGASALATPASSVFQQIPPYGPLGAQIVQHVVKELGLTKVAIAFSPDDIGEPFRDGAVAALKQMGMQPVATVQFNPSATDQSSVAAQLKASGAQAVLANHIPQVVSQLSKAAAQIGFKPQWASTFALDASNLGDISGGTLDGVYMSTPYILGDSADAAEYRDALKAHDASLDPESPTMVEGWSTADVCAKLLEKAVTAVGGKAPGRKDILAAAESFSLDNTYSHGLAWTDSYHAGQKQAQIIQFKDDKFRVVVPFAAMPDIATS